MDGWMCKSLHTPPSFLFTFVSEAKNWKTQFPWWAHICFCEALLAARLSSADICQDLRTSQESWNEPLGHPFHTGLLLKSTSTKCLFHKMPCWALGKNAALMEKSKRQSIMSNWSDQPGDKEQKRPNTREGHKEDVSKCRDLGMYGHLP